MNTLSEMEEKLNAILDNPEAMSRIMELANQLSGGGTAAEKQQQQPPQSDNGSIDPQLLSKLLPLIKEAGRTDAPASQLLIALRPYLKEERQSKVGRAIRLAHVIHIAKQFLAEGGLDNV